MPKYVDGFVFPVAKKNLAAYRRMAQFAGKLWRKYGALEYKECVMDDPRPKFSEYNFPMLVKPKANEVIWFSFIVFKSKAHRKMVNAKVMKDPMMANFQPGTEMPFNMKRMAVGGFKVIVDA